MPTLGGITLVDPATGLPYKAASAADIAAQMADPETELGGTLLELQQAAVAGPTAPVPAPGKSILWVRTSGGVPTDLIVVTGE